MWIQAKISSHANITSRFFQRLSQRLEARGYDTIALHPPVF